MAATDALAQPKKNTAFRVYFELRTAAGALVTSWAGADSEVSLDGGNFADCTNEATEIQASGCGYLDLTAGEMNADHVFLKITFTNVGAVPVALQFYPDEAGDVRVNAAQVGGTNQTGRDIGASVLLSSGTGTGQLDFTSGIVKSNVTQILGTLLTETAGQIAAAFKKFFNVAVPTGTVNSIPDATAGAAGGLFIAGANAATTVNVTGDITGNLSGSVGSVTGAVGSLANGAITAATIATDAIDADAISDDAVAKIQAGLARTGATITYSGPVAAGAIDTTLYAGDDYNATLGNTLNYTIADTPADYSGGSVTWYGAGVSKRVAASGNAGTVTGSFSFTAAETGAWPNGAQLLQVEVVKEGYKTIQLEGILTIRRRLG